MNFKKLLIAVAAVVVVISTYRFFTRIDRSDAIAVATAFTRAMKNKDTDKASGFYAPEQADAWREATDEHLQGMKSGAKERFFERIPESPAFTAPTTASGKTTITSSDKSFSLGMSQIDGKWYVADTVLR